MVENKVKGLAECLVWINVAKKQESGDRGHHENKGAMNMSKYLG